MTFWESASVSSRARNRHPTEDVVVKARSHKRERRTDRKSGKCTKRSLPECEILAKFIKGKVDEKTAAYHAGAVSSGSSATKSCTTSMCSTVASAVSLAASTVAVSALPLVSGADVSTAVAAFALKTR